MVHIVRLLPPSQGGHGCQLESCKHNAEDVGAKQLYKLQKAIARFYNGGRGLESDASDHVHSKDTSSTQRTVTVPLRDSV